MEKDLTKDKAAANKIVNEMFDKYETNDYMYQKINAYFCNQLSNVFENMNESHNQRVIRFNELTNEQDTFIQSFLNNNQYFYSASTDNFFYYDGIHYHLYNEDDILYKVLNLINRDGSLMTWKQKTRLNIMKRIRETSLLQTVPESATIQSVIDRLCPIIFKTRAETKHFLTILGDNIFRKQSSLIYFIDMDAKFFLTQLNHMSQMFIGCNLSQTFKYKYHDHKYEDCRLVNINSNVKSDITCEQIVNQNVPDILCVACHYSLRYNSADEYIENYCNNVQLPQYVFFMKNMDIHELINEFVSNVIDIDETHNTTVPSVQLTEITSIKSSHMRVPQITWKNMQYLWKQFLGDKNLPAVIFLQTLKTLLSEKLKSYYNPSTDSFVGVCSKFIPSIHTFLDFWNETMIEDDTEYELEIDEMLILFRKWCETNNEFVPQLTDKQMVDLIVYYYPSIEIDRDKYISKVRCSLWDKQLEIQVTMDNMKMQLQSEHTSVLSNTMRVSSPTICQNISIYDAYIFYCKSISGSQTNNRRQIISKGYFEKYIFDNYQEYIIDSKFISSEWYALLYTFEDLKWDKTP
jgi:hypothetical protein